MVTDFVLENLTTKEKITFGQSPTFDYLFNDGDIDWGTVPATHNGYSYPGQVGMTVSSTKINSRDISIVGWVFYWLTDDEKVMYGRDSRVGYAYTKIKEKKGLLDRVVNPMDFVKLTIGSYYIEGKPPASVKFGTDGSENNLYFCKFLLSVYCANPMFRKNVVSRTTLSGKIPRFHFPWVVPKGRGIVGSIRQNYLMLSVENEGSVEVGGKIILEAKGVVKNPTVENVSTGETITVRKTLNPGEKVVITTVDGKEKGIVGTYQGATGSYFQHWDFENTWFKFQPGITLIGYSALDGTETALNVAVEISPEKYNLEEI